MRQHVFLPEPHFPINISYHLGYADGNVSPGGEITGATRSNPKCQLPTFLCLIQYATQPQALRQRLRHLGDGRRDAGTLIGTANQCPQQLTVLRRIGYKCRDCCADGDTKFYFLGLQIILHYYLYGCSDCTQNSMCCLYCCLYFLVACTEQQTTNPDRCHSACNNMHLRWSTLGS